ncbi:MAG: glutamate-5-semialdehyde dehydrogenase [Alphaproteobacteria bacterium]
MNTQNTLTDTNLGDYMDGLGKAARLSSGVLRLASAESKSAALMAMAREVRERRAEILSANAQDMDAASTKGLSASMLDRLLLDSARIDAIASGLEAIAKLPDPVGKIDESWEQPNGLKFSKVRVPIGVIGMIYESRPNVTADAGGLCIKSGNSCILRGGSESARSNRAIHAALIRGLKTVGMPETSIQIIETTDRAAVGHLLSGLGGTVDLIIPRGGKNLISRVQSDARVPVLAHLEGLCHTYINAAADLDKAQKIVLNAKLRRTGVCGSTETLLVDAAIAQTFLPNMGAALKNQDCEMRACPKTKVILGHDAILASNEDFRTEHLASILNIRIVDDIQAAIDHIGDYGSGHTDAIVTEDLGTAQKFLSDVDSAIVIHNASTQYADGGEFGFGAEIGIATGRLHARGPVGAKHLTTYKYHVQGTGQVRP